MSQEKVDKLMSYLDTGKGDIEISLVLDSIEDSVIEELLLDNTILDTHRAKIAVLLNKQDYLVELLGELGYNRTKEHLFPGETRAKEQRTDLFHDVVNLLVDSIIDEIQLDLSKYSSTEELIKDMFDSLLYDSNSYHVEEHGQQIEGQRQRITMNLVPSITELGFVKRKIETSYFLDEKVHYQLQKQIILLYTPDLQIDGYEGTDLYDKVVSSDVDWLENHLTEIADLPFDVLLDLVDMAIITDKNKLIISEFDDQEQLIQLYRLEPLTHDRDLIVDRLERSSMKRLIEDFNQESVVHYIEDRDVLKLLFYDIETPTVKATIAKLLDDSDLAFQVVETFLQYPKDKFIPQIKLKELLLLLTEKQLALLRMTSPTEYQQYILKIVEDKRRQDDHDNAMFA